MYFTSNGVFQGKWPVIREETVLKRLDKKGT